MPAVLLWRNPERNPPQRTAGVLIMAESPNLMGRCSVYNRIAIIKERDNHGYNVLAFGKAETEWHNMGHFGDIRQARNRAGLVKFVLEKVVVSLKKEVLGEVKL